MHSDTARGKFAKEASIAEVRNSLRDTFAEASSTVWYVTNHGDQVGSVVSLRDGRRSEKLLELEAAKPSEEVLRMALQSVVNKVQLSNGITVSEAIDTLINNISIYAAVVETGATLSVEKGPNNNSG